MLPVVKTVQAAQVVVKTVVVGTVCGTWSLLKLPYSFYRYVQNHNASQREDLPLTHITATTDAATSTSRQSLSKTMWKDSKTVVRNKLTAAQRWLSKKLKHLKDNVVKDGRLRPRNLSAIVVYSSLAATNIIFLSTTAQVVFCPPDVCPPKDEREHLFDTLRAMWVVIPAEVFFRLFSETNTYTSAKLLTFWNMVLWNTSAVLAVDTLLHDGEPLLNANRPYGAQLTVIATSVTILYVGPRGFAAPAKGAKSALGQLKRKADKISAPVLFINVLRGGILILSSSALINKASQIIPYESTVLGYVMPIGMSTFLYMATLSAATYTRRGLGEASLRRPTVRAVLIVAALVDGTEKFFFLTLCAGGLKAAATGFGIEWGKDWVGTGAALAGPVILWPFACFDSLSLQHKLAKTVAANYSECQQGSAPKKEDVEESYRGMSALMKRRSFAGEMLITLGAPEDIDNAANVMPFASWEAMKQRATEGAKILVAGGARVRHVICCGGN